MLNLLVKYSIGVMEQVRAISQEKGSRRAFIEE